MGGVRNDMGAYGGPLGNYIPGFLEAACEINSNEGPTGMDINKSNAMMNISNFPNPVKNYTVFEYFLSEASIINFNIYLLVRINFPEAISKVRDSLFLF